MLALLARERARDQLPEANMVDQEGADMRITEKKAAQGTLETIQDPGQSFIITINLRRGKTSVRGERDYRRTFKAIITESAKAFKPFSPKAEAFMAGMASRLAERITAMKPPVPTGKGLMVIKNQLIEREFDKLGLNLGRAPKGNFSAAAYAQGKASAEGVALGGAKALGPRPLAISYRT